MALSDLKPHLKLTIEGPDADAESVFGPGIAKLCQGVSETGSLNAAAKSMGMAYSKAWRIVKGTEKALGIQLLIRDGARGSTLTEDAAKLLEAYHTLQKELQEYADREYAKLIE